LDFNFRTYTILTDPGAAPFQTSAHAIPVRPGAGEGEFTIASFNMERFYDTVNDPATSDAVLSAAGLARRLSKASLAIRNVLQMPDVIGVEEMENPLGTNKSSESVTPTPSSAVLQLVQKIDDDAIAAGQTPPHYVAYQAVSNDIGGIACAILVKPSRIEAVGVSGIEGGLQPDGVPRRPLLLSQPDAQRARAPGPPA